MDTKEGDQDNVADHQEVDQGEVKHCGTDDVTEVFKTVWIKL